MLSSLTCFLPSFSFLTPSLMKMAPLFRRIPFSSYSNEWTPISPPHTHRDPHPHPVLYQLTYPLSRGNVIHPLRLYLSHWKWKHGAFHWRRRDVIYLKRNTWVTQDGNAISLFPCCCFPAGWSIRSYTDWVSNSILCHQDALGVYGSVLYELCVLWFGLNMKMIFHKISTL